MATWTRSITVLFVTSLLGACATSKEDVIPQDGPDMATIYQSHQQAAGVAGDPMLQRNDISRPIQRGDADLRGYTQHAANEIEQVFPILPNPHLVMYVFPHLSMDGAPVPGYSTAFPMYAGNQYAMPGDLYQP